MIKYHKPPFRLKELKIEVTHRCDLNCAHCSSDAHPANTEEMATAECLRILREAAEMGAKEVAFSGGEPLLWSGIAGAVREASQLGLVITVYTSGNAEKCAERIDEISEVGAKRFIFSLFGAIASDHERITRVAGSFQRTLSAIRHADRRGLHTEIHFVPLASSYRALPAIAEVARGVGASQISVLRFVPQGRGHLLREEVLTKVQNLQLKKMILALQADGYKIRAGSPYNFLMLNDDPACNSGIDRMMVRPDGRICPCDAFKQILAEEVVGTAENSILRNAPVAQCWEHSPYFTAVREYLMTPFPEGCAGCGCLERCLSGCLAQKVLASGGLQKRADPDCIMK